MENDPVVAFLEYVGIASAFLFLFALAAFFADSCWLSKKVRKFFDED